MIKLYEWATRNIDGEIKIDIRMKDGIVEVWLPHMTQPAIVAKDHPLTLFFDSAGTAVAPIRLQVWQHQPIGCGK